MTLKDSAKRVLDVAVAGTALVVSAPIQAVAALAVRATMGKPVLFRQTRPGRNGEPFELIKLRTMHHIDESRGRLTDADRMTKLGAFLRATSIDELPTLINVLKGDMSIVGPRPLLMKYLPRYSEEQARRHEVRPGLTGLAQVSGRNSISWEERLRLDVEYVDSWTLLGDLAIVARTALKVLAREGISAEGEVTMGEFWGTEQPQETGR